MSDYSELKRLAEAALPRDDSPHLPCTVAFDRSASPVVVIGLIAEVERLKDEVKRLRRIEEAWSLQKDMPVAIVELMDENDSLRKVLKRIKFRCESFDEQGVGMQRDSVSVMLHIASRALNGEAE